MAATTFDELKADLACGGVAAVLDTLVDRLRDQQQYHELFEALKMQLRWRLGLPVMYQDLGDDLEEPQRRELEDGLIEICREVGLLLLRAGKIREGWMFLRPVGDNDVVVDELAKIDVSDDNLEEYVEVTLHEGVAPQRGFELVLEHYGTCNAITTFEAQMAGWPLPQQQAAAALLVRHVHQELMENVKADIAQREAASPPQTTLRALLEHRDWLLAEGRYHVDTTHLAAVVRFARVIEDQDVLCLALDLTEYGQRLSSMFQFAGEEPFVALYPSHQMYFKALLGQEVEASLAYFRHRAESVTIDEEGTAAAEIYVALLAHLGRYQEAIDAVITMIPPGTHTMGYAPTLFDLCKSAGHYDRLMQLCHDREDLLGFAIALMQSTLVENGGAQKKRSDRNKGPSRPRRIVNEL